MLKIFFVHGHIFQKKKKFLSKKEKPLSGYCR